MTTTKPDIIETYPSLIKGIHPAAELIPAPTEEEFNDLCTSVKEQGIQNPIHVNSDGLLLDGRTRLQAAAVTGVADIPIVTTDPDDTIAFVLAQNLHRRHITSVQKAAILARISTSKWGGDRKLKQGPRADLDRPLTHKELSEKYGVRVKAISENKYVQEWAPTEAKQVEAGTMPLKVAIRTAQRNEAMAKERIYEKTLPPKSKKIPNLPDFMRQLRNQLDTDFNDDKSPKMLKLQELVQIREDMPESCWYELGTLVGTLKGAAIKLASFAKLLELPSGRVKEEPKQTVKSLPTQKQK